MADPDRVTKFWNPVKISKYLNENGQKSHFCEVFLTQNPVNILSRSAIEICTQDII